MNEFYPIEMTHENSIVAKPLPPFPEIEWMDEETVEALRRMTVSEKLHLVGKINREVRRRESGFAFGRRRHRLHVSGDPVGQRRGRTG